MTTNPPADAAKLRLEQTIEQLSRMERNAAFGGAGTSVRVSDAPYLIETLTLVQSSLVEQASKIDALTKDADEQHRLRIKAINSMVDAASRATAAEAKVAQLEDYYNSARIELADEVARRETAEAKAAKMREASDD